MNIKKVSEILLEIQKGKYQAYLIGGASRDFLYGRDVIDVDIATNAPFKFIENKFEIIDKQGLSLGSIKIKYKNQIVDITHFRKESYSNDSTYPKISLIDDIEIDASRRDFTINAIYLDLNTNKVVDFYNGLDDLFKFKIKFIGDAFTRIQEDPTRIYRAYRLAAKLNFQIDENDKEIIDSNLKELERLKDNRRQKEIEKFYLDLGETKAKKVLSSLGEFSGINK